MKITNSDGDNIDLQVVGYEFPKLENEYYDSNWLVIKIIARKEGQSWSATHACLLTFEVAKLADWFDDLQINPDNISDIAFTEPNLEFRIVTDKLERKQLRVLFELESRPPWDQSDVAGRQDCWIDFELESLLLSEIARDLRSQLNNYHQRVFP